MTKFKRIGFSLLTALAMLLGGVEAFTGCGSTPQQVTFRTYGTTRVTVQTAMTLWGAYVKQFHPPVDQEVAVKAAYAKWQAAMASVADVGAIYAASDPASTTGAALFASLSQAIADATTIQNDLLDLLQKFGIKT